VDVVLELAGGEDAPRNWVEAAFAAKKHVITANKALLAKHGKDLFPLAEKAGCFLLFEAAVGGGIPIIRTLQEAFIANDIHGLACIINGTCNYILTEMTRKKVPFAATHVRSERFSLDARFVMKQERPAGILSSIVPPIIPCARNGVSF
jgi:homoserine dehydrogenase